MSTKTRTPRAKRVSDSAASVPTRSKYFEDSDSYDGDEVATPYKTKAKSPSKAKATKSSPVKATPTKNTPVKTKGHVTSNGNNKTKDKTPKKAAGTKKTRRPTEYDTDDEEDEPSELSSIDTPEPDDVYAASEDGHRQELDSDALDEDSDEYDIHAAPKKKKGDADADSDDLDEDDFDFDGEKDVDWNGKKRKRGSSSPTKSKKSGSASPKKPTARKRRKTRKDEDDEDDEEYDDNDLGEGQEVVGKVVQAPKSGRGAFFFPSSSCNSPFSVYGRRTVNDGGGWVVPAGQISQNTFNFLAELKVPEHNDREWYVPPFIHPLLFIDTNTNIFVRQVQTPRSVILHRHCVCRVIFGMSVSPWRSIVTEPVYRLAEKEWKDFVEQLTDDLIEVDPQIPPLPPKDVIHRIYRDVRLLGLLRCPDAGVLSPHALCLAGLLTIGHSWGNRFGLAMTRRRTRLECLPAFRGAGGRVFSRDVSQCRSISTCGGQY